MTGKSRLATGEGKKSELITNDSGAGSLPKTHSEVIKSPSDQIKAGIIIARCKLNTLTQLLV